ncbi:JNK-interacting protein 1 [Frankliniella fusca]|uniref:JNK-interacting protein 1 n=1 Tax=Frankliniella fusca TaxID=407009 RepID=A0AAE1I253_9NEOP|nr:JNK-interacting protein 1 [Frankliniella fusca]
MADTEFEQFRQSFERLPQHIKATAKNYTLVHDLALDDDNDGSTSSTRSDSDEEGGGGGVDIVVGGTGVAAERSGGLPERRTSPPQLSRLDGPGPPRSRYVWAGVAGATPVESGSLDDSSSAAPSAAVTSSSAPPGPGGGVAAGATPSGLQRERRRRRLPEIPQSAKNAAAVFWNSCSGCSTCRMSAAGGGAGGGPMSLAAELGAVGAADLPVFAPVFAPGGVTRPLLVLKCAGLDGAGSPDSQTDTLDSGHSTMHSPQLQHDSLSPNSGSAPGSPTSSAGTDGVGGAGGRLPTSQLELLEATHRGLYKFVPRHRDEIEVEIGDLIYVQKEADDLWCEGVNLRTGRQGCFPSAYAVDLAYAELDPSEPRVRRERFLMRYLGSVETQRHKGTAVLAAAVGKMVGQDGSPKGAYTPCVLEVSDKGLRMSDSGRGKRPRTSRQTPLLDYFYSLKHVSFCAYLPRDQRFLGFITKHPQAQRFACHVFQGQESTRPVAESVGRAFQRFYQKYVETAFPVEDIYID